MAKSRADMDSLQGEEGRGSSGYQGRIITLKSWVQFTLPQVFFMRSGFSVESFKCNKSYIDVKVVIVREPT